MRACGVSSSKTTTKSTASRPPSTWARSDSERIGRPSPLSRLTEASLLMPTTRTSPCARASGEELHVTRVEEVEAAVREDDALVRAPQHGRDGGDVRAAEHLLVRRGDEAVEEVRPVDGRRADARDRAARRAVRDLGGGEEVEPAAERDAERREHRVPRARDVEDLARPRRDPARRLSPRRGGASPPPTASRGAIRGRARPGASRRGGRRPAGRAPSRPSRSRAPCGSASRRSRRGSARSPFPSGRRARESPARAPPRRGPDVTAGVSVPFA